MIWMRRYPTMQHLAMHFSITVGCVHSTIHRCILLLHAYLVPKYIRWHSMPHWRNLGGTYPEWPRVVAILDGTPFRISKPKGPIQRLFYRGDRKCFFLNWLVIVDVHGFIVFSQPGFTGRVHDNTCLRWENYHRIICCSSEILSFNPNFIIYSQINLPVLPAGLQIMADQGFQNRNPVLVLPRFNQPGIPPDMRR